MKDTQSLEAFHSAPIPTAVLKNALQAMGAAAEALVINLSRQGLIYIPMLFILRALLGIDGVAWAQPVADVLSLALVAVLCLRTLRRLSAETLRSS